MEYHLATDSTLHSAPYSAPYSKICVLVSSLTTIVHAIISRQDTLHASFISKKSCVLHRGSF